MAFINRKEPIILFLGDFLFLAISLWLSLFFRYSQVPSWENFEGHFKIFLIIFIASLLSFFLAGLYDRFSLLVRGSLPQTLLKAQVINIVLAVVFFYLVPSLQIAPKTILFIYCFISVALLVFWRLKLYPLFSRGSKQAAMVIASGREIYELEKEINAGPYPYSVSVLIDLDKIQDINIDTDIIRPIHGENLKVIVVDTKDARISHLLKSLYNLALSGVQFSSFDDVYEQVFGRVPLSTLNHGWFLENIRTAPRALYDSLKKIIDISLAFILFIITLPLYPLVTILIKNDGTKDSIFFLQERVGKDNRPFKVIKFRSMTGEGASKRVTAVGNFLRKTRIDEIPQLINVMKGEMALIGPRPEMPNLVAVYEDEIPFYSVRHLVTPGLSGWAQIYHENHPHHSVDQMATKEKLSYDLFYIKHRSLGLDLRIAMFTLKTLLSRKGR